MAESKTHEEGCDEKIVKLGLIILNFSGVPEKELVKRLASDDAIWEFANELNISLRKKTKEFGAIVSSISAHPASHRSAVREALRYLRGTPGLAPKVRQLREKQQKQSEQVSSLRAYTGALQVVGA